MSAVLSLPPEVSDRERLHALSTYAILDTPPEKGFDDIADLAAEICGSPVALVSLVAGERQWFKAKVGFEPCQTPLDQSVCAHALVQSDLLVIQDLTTDPRTRQNTLVTGEPYLRFYAGAPLETADGHRLGTLCVIDKVPRPQGLSPSQASSLRKLAGQVVAQLELRRAVRFRDEALADQRATLRRHDALAEAQEAVSKAGGDLDASLDALVAGAMKAVPQAEGGVIEMLEGDGLVYRSVRGSLVPHKGLRLPLHGSLSGHCLRTGSPASSSDVLLDDRVKQDVVAQLGMRSALYVPVMRAGSAIGVLKLQSSRVDAFADDDLEFVRLFAGTVAAGLAQAGAAEAQRSVRAGRDRYRAVFDSAIDYAIVVMDLDGLVDDWNAGAARILGWQPAEMVRRPADVFFTPEDRAAGIAAKEMRTALEQGRGIDERWHIRKDGTRFWANGEMMALRDEAGEAIGFLKILRDRTEQRDAAARLQESESFLRSVLDSSADCIKVLDLDARLGFMNEGGRQVMEVDEFDGVAGSDWTGFWDGPGRADARAAVDAALAGGVGRFTGPACTMKGTRKWWDVQVTPIRDGGGRRVAAAGGFARRHRRLAGRGSPRRERGPLPRPLRQHRRRLLRHRDEGRSGRASARLPLPGGEPGLRAPVGPQGRARPVDARTRRRSRGALVRDLRPDRARRCPGAVRACRRGAWGTGGSRPTPTPSASPAHGRSRCCSTTSPRASAPRTRCGRARPASARSWRRCRWASCSPRHRPGASSAAMPRSSGSSATRSCPPRRSTPTGTGTRSTTTAGRSSPWSTRSPA